MYLPTPEQIRRKCAKIRAGWTAAERRRRRVARPSAGIRTVRVANLEPFVSDYVRNLTRNWN